MCYIPTRPRPAGRCRWSPPAPRSSRSTPTSSVASPLATARRQAGCAVDFARADLAPIARGDAAARDSGDPAARLGGIHRSRHAPAATWAAPTSCSSCATPKAASQQQGLFEGRGPLAILLIVFLGGLALNLTPCVLPMIPINLAIIGAGRAAGSRGRGFWLGRGYGGAMARRLRRARPRRDSDGRDVRHHQLVAVVQRRHRRAVHRPRRWRCSTFWSSTSRSIRVASRSASRAAAAWSLAFTMGAVAALLAGACVAPVVIQVVLFSSNLYATGTTAALALPFFLGIGMAVPWPIARRRHGGAAQARRVDGPRQTGLRRFHPGHGGLLRLRVVLDVLQPLGRRVGGRLECPGKAQRGLARVARRGTRHRRRANKSRCSSTCGRPGARTV